MQTSRINLEGNKMHWMKFGDWPISRKLSAFVVFVVMVMTIGTAGSLYFKRV